jgi:hypothetical protein
MDYTSRGDLWKFRSPDHFDSGTSRVVYAETVYGRDALGRITSITDPLAHINFTGTPETGRTTNVHVPLPEGWPSDPAQWPKEE